MADIEIQSGYLGTVVTSLEMNTRPPMRPMPVCELQLERWHAPSLHKYRTLFRRVGNPWLWVSRLELDDAQLTHIIHDPAVMIWAVIDRSGIEVGILELDFREADNCELSFFGLVPELNGKGYGRWLMAVALQSAWGYKGVKRVWVHTCTLDGPGALGFYRQSGFVPYERMLETFPDPRISGLIPVEAAPHVPIIR